MKEHRGEWRQVSRCRECGLIVGKEVKWMDHFFVKVCPGCGEYNNTGGYLGSGRGDLFEGVVARQVRAGFLRRFVRWELKKDTEEKP